jgi:hypothetical protein
MGRRLVVAACALVCAGATHAAPRPPLAAKTPALLVAGATATGASAQTTVELKEEKTDAAPFRVTIYAPTSYVANISQSPGTQIGTVDGTLQALIVSPDTLVTASGTVTVGDPTSTALRTSATQCTGTPVHAAIWVFNLTAMGNAITVPVYVDPTSGTEAAFSSAKLVLCLPNPYEQALPGTRSPAGAKFTGAKILLSAGVLTNPSSAGTFVWRSAITPWTVNGPAPNAAATIEAQSIVNLPEALTLKAKLTTGRHKTRGRTAVTNSVLLSGKLLENLTGISGAKVAFFSNGKSAGSATTGASGSFSKKLALKKKASFRVTATVPDRETACVSPLPASTAPGGCAAATTAGYKLTSNAVAVKPKER